MDTQGNYLVRWDIELTAVSPQAAARQALEVMRERESHATLFKVMDMAYATDFETVDLGWEPCEKCGEIHLNATCEERPIYKVWANIERWEPDGETYEEVDGAACIGMFATEAEAVAFCKGMDPQAVFADDAAEAGLEARPEVRP